MRWVSHNALGCLTMSWDVSQGVGMSRGKLDSFATN